MSFLGRSVGSFGTLKYAGNKWIGGIFARSCRAVSALYAPFGVE